MAQCKPLGTYIYFWGYDIDPKQRLKVRILDFLQNRKRIFDYSNESLDMLTKNLEKFHLFMVIQV